MLRILFVLALCLSCHIGFSQNKIERVEPPNWWVGMEHNQIQIMVYGENIAELKPFINSRKATLNKVDKVENPNYLFLDVTIHPQPKV